MSHFQMGVTEFMKQGDKMKEYKGAKIFIVTTAVLSCLIVLLTFCLAFFKNEGKVVTGEVVSSELMENTKKVSAEYKGESFAFKTKDTEEIIEKFFSLDLTAVQKVPETEGKLIFETKDAETGEKTVLEIGFDERLETLVIDGKAYKSDKLLSFKNLLVTLSRSEKTTEVTSTETTTIITTTAAETKKEETTTEKTAFYSTEEVDYTWGGTKAYLKVMEQSENTEFIIKNEKKYFPVVKITDVKGLNGFIESMSEYFTVNGEKYDKEFFKEKQLFIIYVDESTKTNGFKVEKVDIDGGKMNITVNDTETGEQGLKSRLIFLSIEKKAVSDCTEFNAFTDYVK